MGYGEFGSNGSLHWKVGYDDTSNSPDHVDYDTIDYNNIGKGSHNDKTHKGLLHVRLRFKDLPDANARLLAAANSAAAIPGVNGIYAVVEVPIVGKRADPNADPFWEVRVDW